MATERYMLDTNTVSYLIKGKPESVRARLQAVPMTAVCVSSITKAELLHGVARKPDAKHLPIAVNEFLRCVDVLSWDSSVAEVYAVFRTAIEEQGKALGAMDVLIAAHSIAAGATLITNDKAFYQVKQHLTLQDWTV